MSAVLETARRAIVRVGGGRGFVVEIPNALGGREKAIVTAAHCLPAIPPAHPVSYIHERTFASLLGPLGAEPSYWAQCVFVDPIADLAVLAEPDGQELFDPWDAFNAWIEELPALGIAQAVNGPAWRLSLANEWVEGAIVGARRGISAEWQREVESGMSGSPIVQAGRAVGLVSVGNHFDPSLARGLPAWVFTEVQLSFLGDR